MKLPDGTDLRQVTVLSKQDLDRIERELNRKQIENELARRIHEEREEQKRRSKEIIKNWPNTIAVSFCVVKVVLIHYNVIFCIFCQLHCVGYCEEQAFQLLHTSGSKPSVGCTDYVLAVIRANHSESNIKLLNISIFVLITSSCQKVELIGISFRTHSLHPESKRLPSYWPKD